MQKEELSAEIQNNSLDDIDLNEFFNNLFKNKIRLLVITLIFSVFSIFYAFSLPDSYKATVILAPSQNDSGGISSNLSQLGGIAAIAGFNVGTAVASESRVAQEIMKSWNFIDKFVSSNNLSIPLYASKGWRREDNSLIIDKNLYDLENRTWLIQNINGQNIGPSSWDIYKSFLEVLSVSEDLNTGLVEVSIEFYSPSLAKEWLDLFVYTINKNMQERQINKVSNNLLYLQEQIQNTSSSEIQEILYKIIEEQMKNKMLAQASPEYVFVVVNHSMLPEIKSKPGRLTIIILGTLIGFIFSIISVTVLHFVRK